jgi:hypothetical protein
MSRLRRRLTDVEDRQAVRDWQEDQRRFEGRSQDELQFFAVYGYFPDCLEGELPQRQEFTVAGIRTVIIAERMST